MFLYYESISPRISSLIASGVVTPLLTITILLRDRDPLSNETSLFLSCSTLERNLTNSALASPSLGGAALEHNFLNI